MGLNDPKTDMKVISCIDPVTIAAAGTTDGTSIDTKGFRWATFIVQIGTQGGATTTGTSCKITSDPLTGGSFATDISGAAFTAATLLAGDCVLAGRIDLHKLDYSTSRWLRAELTFVGAAVSCPVSAVCILSNSEDPTKYQTVAFDFGV